MSVTNYKNFIIHDDGNTEHASFMFRDIDGLKQYLGSDTKIIEICSSYGESLEERTKIFKEIIDNYQDYVILTTNCISTLEFPEAEYNDPFGKPEDRDPNKKDINTEAVQVRDEALLLGLGFVDINFYVNYEFSNAFMYANEAAKPYLEYLYGKRSK